MNLENLYTCNRQHASAAYVSIRQHELGRTCTPARSASAFVLFCTSTASNLSTKMHTPQSPCKRLSLSLSLSLSHTHTHNHTSVTMQEAISLSLSHTHTQSHLSHHARSDHILDPLRRVFYIALKLHLYIYIYIYIAV
jgi:hypothetical protein